MYTRGPAWYLNREDDMGSIESGKFADARRTRAALTVVGGKIVHDSGIV